MKIFKIVLTGGPCAGKTTAIKTIKNHLEENGIPCLIVPETATELLPNIQCFEMRDVIEFQRLVMKRQLTKEYDTINYAKRNYSNYDKVVILYDRGLFDGLAYLETEQTFRKMLSSFMKDDITSLNGYDLVIDLLSLATCKSNEYNLSNEVRKESVDLATILDNKTSNAWANHYNMKIVSSNVSLDEETKTILNVVDSFINDKMITKRISYLVNINASNLTKYKEMEPVLVSEHFFEIGSDNGYKCSVSLKSRQFSSPTSYIVEIYKEEDNKKYIFYRKLSDTDEFGDLCRYLKYIDGKQHNEINFVENGTLYRLNFNKDDTVTLEIQISENSEKIVLPEEIKVYNNITTPVFNKFNSFNKEDKGLIKVKKIVY